MSRLLQYQSKAEPLEPISAPAPSMDSWYVVTAIPVFAAVTLAHFAPAYAGPVEPELPLITSSTPEETLVRMPPAYSATIG